MPLHYTFEWYDDVKAWYLVVYTGRELIPWRSVTGERGHINQWTGGQAVFMPKTWQLT